MVYPRTSVNCKIIMHTYDYAIPNGKGVFGEAGWLKPALVDAKVPGNLQADCMTYLIDSFFKVLTAISRGDSRPRL